MIEAMACGTPVIAWANGSVPEVLEHGVTGFIVKSEQEAVFAISRLDRLDRNLIRREFSSGAFLSASWPKTTCGSMIVS
jgi:glycosyltransferase involved in cell wall biosynthesis